MIDLLLLLASTLITDSPLTPRRILPGQSQPYDPRSYRSANGRCELFVKPSASDGEGPAEYRLVREGSKAWKRVLPFALQDVGLADDGTFAGFGQTEGARVDEGKLRIAVVGSDGGVRKLHEHDRAPTRFLHAPTAPCALDGFLVGENGPFLLRVADDDVNRRSEAWWLFDLGSGAELARVRPKESETDAARLLFALAAVPVSGTPLVLVQWYELEESRSGVSRRGTRFTLLEVRAGVAASQTLERVWSIDRPDDFERPSGSPTFQLDRLLEGKENASIVRWDEKRRFDLWFTKEDERATFEVTGDAVRGWSVLEVARASAAPDVAEPTSRPAEPTPTLSAFGIVDLDPCQEPLPAVHDVSAFAFDGSGNIAFLRWEHEPYQLALVHVDRQGKLLAKHALREFDLRKGTALDDLAWIGGDRFVVAWSPYHQNGSEGTVCMVAAGSGSMERVQSRITRDLHGLASFPDGRFVVLGDNQLYAFDREGALQWTRTGADKLCGADELAVLADGRIVLLDKIPDGLQWLDASGRIGSYRALERLWSREPRYPVGLESDLDGGMILEDDHCLVRMDGEGRRLGDFVPHFPDGRKLQPLRTSRVGPDGRRWISDRDALHALDTQGKVVESIGESHRPERLGSASTMLLDVEDRVWSVSEKSGRVFRTEVGDVSKSALVAAPPEMAARMWKHGLYLVLDAGAPVLLERSKRSNAHARWSTSGERLGEFRVPPSDDGAGSFAGNAPMGNWWIADRELMLVDGEGKLVLRIQRRPDGTWIRNAGAARVAPDGSIAVLDGDALVYGPDGTSRAQIALDPGERPPHALAYDGARVVVVVGDEVRVHDVAKSTRRSLRLPGVRAEETAYWEPFLPRKRSELWLFNGGHELRRYALPR